MREQAVVQEAPQDTAARLFMEHKGYPDIRPEEVEQLDDEPCWYYFYRLPEGRLELEVFWDKEAQDWQCTSVSFVAD